MFIVFEGIDGSGKTTQSKLLANSLKFKWTKEPTFSTEQADNFNKNKHNAYKREAFFLTDRAFHQTELTNANIICDRYIWSGFAYLLTFGPETYDMVIDIYSMPAFRKPDIYVFIDTLPDICYSRRQDFDIEVLLNIRANFFKTLPLMQKWGSKVLFIPGDGTVEEIQQRVNDVLPKDNGNFLKNYLINQELQMYKAIGRQVEISDFNALIIRRGFTLDEKKRLLDALKIAGLDNLLKDAYV